MEITMVDSDGNHIETVDIPDKRWKALEQVARDQGITVDEAFNQALGDYLDTLED